MKIILQFLKIIKKNLRPLNIINKHDIGMILNQMLFWVNLHNLYLDILFVFGEYLLNYHDSSKLEIFQLS